MPLAYENDFHSSPLVRDIPAETLHAVDAALHCLQHLDSKAGLDDEAHRGANLILEFACEALRFEAGRRLSRAWLARRGK